MSMPSPNPHEAAYNPVVEAWRFFAACIVVLCHYRAFWTDQASYWDLTATGVDLFFVLSGFVFAPTLLQGMRSYRAFMIRRFFRMYPLYLAALLMYAMLPGKPFSWEIFGAHVAMLQTTLDPRWASAYNPAFWSLPPEWAFYCVMPLFIFCVRAIGLLGCVLVAVLVRVALGFWVEPLSLTTTSFTIANWAVINLPGIAIEFLFGVWVYRWQTHLALRAYQLWIGILWCVFFGIAVWFYGQAIVGAQPHPFIGNLVGLIAAAFYAVALWLSLHWSALWSEPLRQRAFYVGALSYGIYLFHNAAPQWLQLVWPTASAAGLVVGSLVATFIVAHWAHVRIEAPLRQFGRQLSARYLPSQN